MLAATWRSSSTVMAKEGTCEASNSPLLYKLTAKRRLSPDSYLLRYSLPVGRQQLGEDPTLPTCIKVLYPNGTDEKTGLSGNPLEKSYSPVSHPAVEGYMELVVKSYAERDGGGVGSYLCGMNVSETMIGTVKGRRIVHGSPAVLGRWTNIGLVAGGTGIAPLLQVARIVLESRDPVDAPTTVRLLFINSREEDILALTEIEDLASRHPGRFHVAYSLTGPSVPEHWAGYTCRGDMAMVSAVLPPPTGNGKTMIFVCGTDGFVATWAGPVRRAPNNLDGSRGAKIQGPLLGLLREAGYTAEEVFKY